MPPVSVNVIATALEHYFAVGEVKPEIHRQGVALFPVPAGWNAVRVFAQAHATAVMVNRDNPANRENLSCGVGKRRRPPC